MIVLDGSQGEGGGQILRTALSLAMVTGQSFRIEQIRKKRSKPGLLRQHLTAVEAAAQISGARVEGAELGSQRLAFVPSKVRGGSYEFAIGTAGSTTLVLQTVLPALLTADAPSQITLHGGTHNPLAPSFDFLAYAYAPVLLRMGAKVDLQMLRPGYFPAGGGEVHAAITPGTLQPLELLQRGDHQGFTARAQVAGLPRQIAERELAVVRNAGIPGPGQCLVETCERVAGPGNSVSIALRFAAITEVVSTLGERGKRAEDVAQDAVQQAFAYLHHDAPVGEHLADQLLLPLALAGGGTFRTTPPSEHTRTNAEVIEQLLPVAITLRPDGPHSWVVAVRAR